MDSAIRVVQGMIGGFISVSIIYLLVNKNSGADKLLSSAFGGFSKTLNVAMGGKA